MKISLLNLLFHMHACSAKHFIQKMLIGAFRVWLRDQQVSYFILRGPPVAPPPEPETDNDDFSVISKWMMGEKSSAGTVAKVLKYE